MHASVNYAQTIYLQVDPVDMGAVEANQTDDRDRQNNGYNGNDWSWSQLNTDCADCTGGGAVDMDVTAIWECGGNYSINHFLEDRDCGYRTFNYPSSGGTTYGWTVSKGETIQVRISGAEDDIIFCTGNDGQCSPSPYTSSWGSLPNARATYNANNGSWSFTHQVDIDQNRCPYSWTGYMYSAIENCHSDNSTNDYIVRWRYRYHFGNSSGTLSGMDAPNINGSDYSTCSGSYNRGTLTASSFTNCAASYQWQYSYNDGSWTNISGATGTTYDPPTRYEGKHEYRFRVGYRNNFSGGQGYTYSNVRTDLIEHTPSLVSITNSSSCWQANNSNTYTLSATVRDNGSGIDRVLLLINYGDTGGNPNAGYFGVDNDGYIWSANQYSNNGWYASKHPSGYGYQYINLVGFNTTVSGSDRTFNFIVRPDTDFPEGTDMDVSFYLYDETNNYLTCNDGWSSGTPGTNNYNLNFTAYRSPFATASTNNGGYCTGSGSTVFTLSNPAPGSFVRWQYRWNNSGSWNNWGTTNPYTWSNSTNCGNTLYVRAQTTYGNCTEYSNVVTSSVDCAPSSNTPTVNNPYICAGGSATFTTSITSGSFVRYQYQWDGTGGSWNNWGSTNPYTWNPGNPSYNGRPLYVRTQTVNGACTRYSSPVVVYLYYDATPPSMTKSPNVATVCAGRTLTVSASGAANGIDSDGTSCANQYRYSTNGGSSWTSWSSTIPSFTAVANGSNHIQSRRLCSGSGCGETTNEVSWSVVSDPSLSAPAASTTICPGGSLSLTSNLSGGTGSQSPIWQYSPNGSSGWATVSNGTPSGAAYTNQSTATLTVSGVSASGTYYYRRHLPSTSNGCNATSSSAQVTVVPDPGFTAPAASTTLCSGGSASLTSSLNGGTGSQNPVWQYSATGSSGWANVVDGTPSGVNYANESTATLGISGLTAAGNYYYRRRLPNTGLGCNATSATAQITVVNDPSLSAPAASTSICPGGGVNLTSNLSGGTGTQNPVWQYSANGSTGWANVSDGTPSGVNYSNEATATLSIAGLTTAGNYYFRRHLPSTGAACNATSATGQVTVVSDPTLSAPTASTSICPGVSVNLTSNLSGGTGTQNPVWQYSADGSSGWASVTNGTPSGVTYTNAATATLTVSGLSPAGSYYFRRHLPSTGIGCNATSTNAQVTVVNEPTLSAPAASTPICAGGSVNLISNLSGGTGTMNPVWQYSADGSSGWAAVSNGTPVGATYTNTSTATLTVSGISAAGSYYYRRILTASSAGCDAVGANAEINVYDDPSITAQPIGSQNTCVGGDALALTVVVSGGSPALQYQWQSSSTSGSGFTDIPLATTNTYTPTGISTNTYYQCVITDANNGCSSPLTSNEAAVLVAQPSDLLYLIPQSDPFGFNGANLVETCEDANGFTYYTIPGVHDKYVFSINWDFNNNGNNSSAKATAVPYVTVDAGLGFNSFGTPPCLATWTMRRYWNVTTSAPLDSPVVVRFYYDPGEWNTMVSTKAGHGITYSCQDEGQEWFKVPGTFDPATDVGPGNPINAEYLYNFNRTNAKDNNVLYAEFIVSSFSGGTGAAGVGPRNDPLPVELINFTATARDRDIHLEWTTLSEVNNEKFEVLKSLDGVNFMKIGEVPGNGTTSVPTVYEFNDTDVRPGVVYYYQLNQMDYDGTSELSNIVSARIDGDLSFSIGDFSPNPTFELNYIEINTPEDQDIHITILDMLGREMLSDIYFARTGINRIIFDLNSFPQGSYIATFATANSGIHSRKFSVVK